MTQFVNNDVSSGAVVFASDHNTQGAQVAAVLNGGIQNDNIASDAAIDGSKLADGGITPSKLTTGASTSWGLTSYSVTWGATSSNPTIGNGTLTSYYIQTGKAVKVYIAITYGSTTNPGSGTFTFSLPVTASATGMVQNLTPLGNITMNDNGTRLYTGRVYYYDTTTVRTKMNHVTSDFVENNSFIAHNDPFTGGTGDGYYLTFEYMAA